MSCCFQSHLPLSLSSLRLLFHNSPAPLPLLFGSAFLPSCLILPHCHSHLSFSRHLPLSRLLLLSNTGKPGNQTEMPLHFCILFFFSILADNLMFGISSCYFSNSTYDKQTLASSRLCAIIVTFFCHLSGSCIKLHCGRSYFEYIWFQI